MYCKRVPDGTLNLLIASILLLAISSITAQELEGGAGESVKPELLLARTLALDIESADIDALRLWLRRLNLDDSGSQEVLRRRLKEHYSQSLKLHQVETEVPGKEEASGTGRMRISVEKAEQLSYSTTEEELLRLDGGVLIRMENLEDRSVHSIEAGSLIYNRSTNDLSAIGQVRYVMESGDERHEFVGQELGFDLTNYRGVFLQGLSRYPQSIGDRELIFFFRGDGIYRIRRDVIHLEGGILSSSREDTPYYRIAAGDIWVLGLNEWALRNATLYVGHVPVFYFPFFFHPGRRFILRPSVGYKNLEGNYVQTNTYFLGRPPREGQKQGGDISFLQLIDGGEENYRWQHRGFFLQPVRKEAEETWAEASGSYGRVQVDYYSNLGLLSALDLNLRGLGSFTEIRLLAGIGLTKYIYTLPGYPQYFSSLSYDPDEELYQKRAQQPYLFGNSMPFRFGFDLSLDYKEENVSIQLDIPLYTDLLLRDQLQNRDEGGAWANLLSSETGGFSRDFEKFNNPVLKQHSSFALDVFEQAPFIDTFRFDKFDSQLYLSQGELAEDEDSYNKLGFYYPQLLTPLDLALNVKGRLIADRQTKAGAAASSEEEVDLPIREPESMRDSEVSKEVPVPALYSRKLPDIEGDLALPRSEELKEFSHSMDYGVNPRFSYHKQYDQPSIPEEGPEAIDFKPLYSSLHGGGSAALNYKAQGLDGKIFLTQSTLFRGRYRRHYDAEDRELLIEQARELSYMSVFNDSELQYFFLPHRSIFSKSKISYGIENRLFHYNYNTDIDAFESRLLTWDEESIGQHWGEVKLISELWGGDQSLGFLYNLPPADQSFVSTINLNTGPLKSRLSLELEEEEGGAWRVGPLLIREDIEFADDSSVSQEFRLLQKTDKDDLSNTRLDLTLIPDKLDFYQRFQWNLEHGRPERSETRLRWGWWSNSLVMHHGMEYRYETGNGWVSEGRESFQVYKFRSSLNIPYDPDPFWKNRIRFESDFSVGLQLDFIRYNESTLDFSWDTSLQVAEFLDFDLRVRSGNSAVYRYFPEFSQEVAGLPARKPVTDLLRSFNFFDTQDRLDSYFNLKEISFSLVHYMRDWNLTMQYSGSPQLDERNRYRWANEFSIFVQWNPIPEVKKEFDYGEEGFVF